MKRYQNLKAFLLTFVTVTCAVFVLDKFSISLPTLIISALFVVTFFGFKVIYPMAITALWIEFDPCGYKLYRDAVGPCPTHHGIRQCNCLSAAVLLEEEALYSIPLPRRPTHSVTEPANPLDEPFV